MTPEGLDRALKVFDDALFDWLQAGGDQRLKAFTPLRQWKDVVEIMVRAGEPAIKRAEAD